MRGSRKGCGSCRAALTQGVSVFEGRPRYVCIPEKGVALFEQRSSWACVFSRDGRGMYTYLTNGAKRHSRCSAGATTNSCSKRATPTENWREKALSPAPARVTDTLRSGLVRSRSQGWAPILRLLADGEIPVGIRSSRFRREARTDRTSEPSCRMRAHEEAPGAPQSAGNDNSRVRAGRVPRRRRAIL